MLRYTIAVMRFYPLVQLLSSLALTGLLLAGCGQSPERVPVSAQPEVNMSGAWQVDYSESENIRESYDALIRDLQRRASRQQRGMSQGGGTLAVGGGSASAGASVYALARMAEIVTEPQLLDITQSDGRINIKREGSFALDCEYHSAQLDRRVSPLGSEICGWDGHQLLFQISLPEGLSIQHRFTLGPDGERIKVATTLRSSGVSQPFTLDRVYRRYDPEADGIRCTQTLTSGRVCTTEKPQP